MKQKRETDKLPRRNFLAQTGLAAGGLGIGALGLNAALQAGETEGKEAPEWPWPYKELDVELVRKRGHRFYYEGGCMYGVSGGLLSVLAETVGDPWNTFPHDMMRYGGGGIAGVGDVELLAIGAEEVGRQLVSHCSSPPLASPEPRPSGPELSRAPLLRCVRHRPSQRRDSSS